MSESKFRSGIYKITINDYYIYIGQSVDVKSRCKQHLRELKQNKHYNKRLQSVFNKYPNSIKFEILEECEIDKLDEREMFYIDYYRSYGTKHGLNMSIGGDCGWRKYKTKEDVEVAKKQYYYDNKEKIRSYTKQWYNNHEKELKVKRKRWYRDNKKQKGILSKKERFEIRYSLSRSLTDEEWNIWCNTKHKFKCYAIKFLNTLSNITFYSKIVKFKNK